ncbi:MAG: tetratricopeptide repeat protein [Bacteroidota bacterium]
MKNIFLYILLNIGLFANAQDIDSLFIKANKLYQSDKYSQALELYNQVEKQGAKSAALYYNMANTFFKTNQVAPSIYYYEKALALQPNDKDILFNLDYANRMTIDHIEPLPKSLGQKFRENVVLRFTYNTWAIIAASLAFLFAILFLLYHFSYDTSKKRIYFITSIISAILVFVSVTFAFQNENLMSKENYAIIFASKTNAKSAPTQTGEINFELHEGTKVQILETLGNWKKIKIADGNMGWIKAEDIKEL